MRASDTRQLKYIDFLNSLTDYIDIPKKRYVPIDEVIDLLNKIKEEKIFIWKIITQKNETPVTTYNIKIKDMISMSLFFFI